ncbi:MAG: replication-associated recombination protein A [Clostridiales bacterium]|jgi:putative ATPase|nr:replication-associated recombination protein A [Clostridiales bacterium]
MAAPLADRLRPKTLEDMVGQRHLLAPGKVLRKIIESGEIPNLVFYGPSGVGKTTLATMIARQTNRKLFKLNGTTASTSDIRDVVSSLDTLETVNGILLYLDEIQYFNKKQQQTLLEFMENGQITLIASTTENPYFYVYNAILSRSTVFEFKPVEASEVEQAVERAFVFLEGERKETIVREQGVAAYIATACGGDVRKAMNAAELCVLSADRSDGICSVTLQQAKEVSQRSSMRYDKDGEEHYDILSAFQKSMRGSDSNAALHYLARLLEAGDLPSACRRLMVCACEDVGLAWPQILPIVKAAVDIALQVGLPEAQIPLADAVVLVANAPKSNTAYVGIKQAMHDIHLGKVGSIPRQLQNKHCDGADRDRNRKGQFYQYPHEFPNRWVKQQYLPDELKDTVYYEYGDNKNEQAFRLYWEKIKNGTNL